MIARERFMVSFGQKYRREPHPTCTSVHPDGYIVIEADDYDSARQATIEHFGQGWSNLLSESEFDASYYPRGVLETISARSDKKQSDDR